MMDLNLVMFELDKILTITIKEIKVSQSWDIRKLTHLCGDKIVQIVKPPLTVL